MENQNVDQQNIQELFGTGEQLKLNIESLQKTLIANMLQVHIASIDKRLEACDRCPIICENPSGFAAEPAETATDRMRNYPELGRDIKLPYYEGLSKKRKERDDFNKRVATIQKEAEHLDRTARKKQREVDEDVERIAGDQIRESRDRADEAERFADERADEAERYADERAEQAGRDANQQARDFVERTQRDMGQQVDREMSEMSGRMDAASKHIENLETDLTELKNIRGLYDLGKKQIDAQDQEIEQLEKEIRLAKEQHEIDAEAITAHEDAEFSRDEEITVRDEI